MISSLKLSLRSMRNRCFSSLLTMFAIALSIALLLSMERIRLGVKNSFEQSLSGMDLVVGPRGGSLQVLLYSVFHIGSPNNTVDWHSYEDIRSHPEVEWSIPIAMGDSHRGFPVVGTDEKLFKHFKVAGHGISFREGSAFTKTFEAVIGSEIAKKLHYTVGQKIILSHGMGDASFHEHEDSPFVIVGIMKETGSPADQTVYIDLSSLDAIHHEEHAHEHEHEHEHAHAHEHEHEHEDEEEGHEPTISAFFVGLKSKQGILSFQRMVNEYVEEPLMGIIPGLTFMELWSLLSTADTALMLVSVFMIFAGILGMLSSLLTTLESRNREIAILRALGARPGTIFSLFLSEAIFLGLGGYLLGFALVYPILYGMQPFLVRHYGFHMSLNANASYDLSLFFAVLGLASLAGLFPAWKAYRRSLADGLTIRI